MKTGFGQAWFKLTAKGNAPGPEKSGSKLEWHKLYDNIDGTGDLLMGSMLLGFGLLSYLQHILPKDSIWIRNGFCSLIFMYLILGLTLGPAYWIRHLIKKRITWPRTGYVGCHLSWKAVFGSRPPEPQAAPGVPSRKALWKSMLVFMGLSALIGAVVGVLYVIASRSHGSILSLRNCFYVGYLVMWVALYGFWSSRLNRSETWRWLVAIVMAIGLAVIGLVGNGDLLGITRSAMLLVGSLWTASGVITFLSYLGHHKAEPVEPA